MQHAVLQTDIKHMKITPGYN